MPTIDCSDAAFAVAVPGVSKAVAATTAAQVGASRYGPALT